mmetsp:Transcript_11661/g.20985  ORF Transcript_11661/g.20985 Transcript_11661/m.20985 type:complete len:164 (-) Transcript_11661:208-699(-)
MALRGSAAATWGRLVSSGSSLLRSVVTPSTQLAPVAESVNPTPALASTSGPRSWYSSIADLSPGTVDFATLSANKTEYQKILDDARHRIFGTHIGNGERSGRKVLRKALAAEKMADWYMPRLTHIDPVFADPKEDLRKKKLLLMKRRGKGPPPKGQGKRAKKR